MTVVVDTNVILVANEQHADVSPACIEACALRLSAIVHRGRIALDDSYRILTEYQRKTQPRQGKGPGDAFVKWALRNAANPQRCELAHLPVDSSGDFQAFPTDVRLSSFDPADRKFVATSRALASAPPILQAADSKWIDWAPALRDNGVLVEFLCRDDVERFRAERLG